MKNLLLNWADNKNISPENIEKELVRFMIGKPIIPVTDLPYSFVLRSSPNKKGEVFRNVSRCSYNPFKEAIQLQRCNYDNQQVFYAAVTAKSQNIDASSTALMETMQPYVKNHSIRRCYTTISKWKTKKRLRVFVLPFSKRSHKKNLDFQDLFKKFNKSLPPIASLYGCQTSDIKEFLIFMSNIFCTRSAGNKKYKISSAFFNAIMSVAPDVDGLIYPSAMTNAEGMNIALRKELIDNKTLEVELALMLAMQKLPSDSRHIIFEEASTQAIPDKLGNLVFKHIF